MPAAPAPITITSKRKRRILLERAMSRSWDVFCKVIDNFGDAAVCWRLCHQLAGGHGGRVRLWIDELEALRRLRPELARDCANQTLEGVEICQWTPESEFATPAEICIEAFGGGLPETYVEAMAARHPATLWIILEYLSAEPWVTTHHGLPSPHPRLPLARYFYFPGVVPGSGGVLREALLEAKRSAFQSSGALRTRFWRELGFEPADGAATLVSLFGYENRAIWDLLRVWSDGAGRVIAAFPPSPLRSAACAFFAMADPGDGAAFTRGNLEARFLPFLPQPGYDELLWACDWNFVRGEDSFVRAQWAGRPLVWHIYPQQEGAHMAKLDAFLDVYCAGLKSRSEAALRGLWHAWNDPASGSTDLRSVWETLETDRAGLRQHALAWPGRLALPGELAANLAQFCEERLK